MSVASQPAIRAGRGLLDRLAAARAALRRRSADRGHRLGAILVLAAPTALGAPQQRLDLPQCLSRAEAEIAAALEARSENIEAEIRALCAAGDREGAERRARAFARELAASRERRLVEACGEAADVMFAAMPPNARATQDPPFEIAHPCDSEE